MLYRPHRAVIFRADCRKYPRGAWACVLLLVCLLGAAARAQTPTPFNVVISQIYTRGGEPGATYQSDYVEIFNRGNVAVDVNGYALEVASVTNGIPVTTVITVVSSRGIIIEPGKYRLIELARGSAGQPLPAPDFPSFGSFTPNLGAQGGHVALYRRAPTVTFGACPTLSEDLADVVGYGTATCREGQTTVAAPGLTTALVRARAGCNDTQVNAADFQLDAPAPRNSQTPATDCVANPGPSIIQFGVPQFSANEFDNHATITVTRVGETAAPATVEYVATDGTANDRQDYTTTWGTLHFEPGETSKSFDVLLTNDAADEPAENVLLTLQNPTGLATLGTRAVSTLVINDDDFGGVSTSNPIDSTAFFVRQHYHDFLNREPDAEGFQFWTGNIDSCGADQACREVKRIDTSAAFFLSIEFQATGYLAQRLYRAAYADSPTRPRGLPRYREFVRDAQRMADGVVVGRSGWELRLQENQRLFAEEFSQRPEFLARYPASMSHAEYVDALNRNAGGVISEQLRAQMIFNLGSGAFTRGEVLRMVAENRQFYDAEKSLAFVLMQYFGYLRRSPDDAPNTDLSGLDFWLGKLNDHGGDFRSAEMVKSFLVSDEYRRRFAANAAQ